LKDVSGEGGLSRLLVFTESRLYCRCGERQINLKLEDGEASHTLEDPLPPDRTLETDRTMMVRMTSKLVKNAVDKL